MRVFVSSTVFDLLDVRAELGRQLRDLGIDAVLSDDKLSDFRVSPDASSIETCLTNVAACDEFVLILDRRYGPSLGQSGFDDVSATHLEYRRAVDCKLPIHFFVRDRLDADYSVWKRNKRKPDIALPWVSAHDFGLFGLIDEHARLRAGSRSNWCYTFTNSLDLKAALAKRFESKLLPRRLVEAIEANRFPVLDIRTECTQENMGGFIVLKSSSDIVNVGGAPAFNCRIRWDDDEKGNRDSKLLAPSQFIHMSFIYTLQRGRNHVERNLIAEYESPLGVAVTDTFRVGAQVDNNILISGGGLSGRRYRRTSEIRVEIDD